MNPPTAALNAAGVIRETADWLAIAATVMRDRQALTRQVNAEISEQYKMPDDELIVELTMAEAETLAHGIEAAVRNIVRVTDDRAEVKR